MMTSSKMKLRSWIILPMAGRKTPVINCSKTLGGVGQTLSALLWQSQLLVNFLTNAVGMSQDFEHNNLIYIPAGRSSIGSRISAIEGRVDAEDQKGLLRKSQGKKETDSDYMQSLLI